MALRRREESADRTSVKTKTKKQKVEEEASPFEPEDSESPATDVGTVPVGVGWDEAEKMQDNVGTFPRLKLKEDPTLVKFLTNQVISFRSHWVNAVRKSYTCLGDDCPLCDAGDRARSRFVFPVVDLSGEDAVLSRLEFGPRLAEDLKAIDKGKRGPLNRFCIRISRTGEGRDTKYHCEVVKDSDLLDEEDIDPKDVDAAIDGMEPFGTEVIYISSRSDLENAVEELLK